VPANDASLNAEVSVNGAILKPAIRIVKKCVMPH